MILYLHGFTSGPQSVKARALGERMAARGLAADFICPQLPASPAAAIALAEQIIEQHRKVGAADTANNGVKSAKITLVGSSLGGFYATVLAEKFNLNAVLVNPAVINQLPMEDFIGTHRWLYTGEPFEFTAQHIAELRALERPRLSQPERFWLMLEEGDETLDYRQAAAYYVSARQTVLVGGDHSFTRWNDYLDEIIDWSVVPRT
ncbi:MAG: alpha/beta fold hydrolase [Rugosibacter sp.]|nr:MAG: alpha/beta fold hydrolase [Rugosibacter sp.]TBR10580.1 MAG: alpha/beta fold hydrolase [Rugosibacter sp.]